MNILVVDIAAEYGGALAVLKDFYEFVRTDERAKMHKWKFVVSTTKIQSSEHISIEEVKKGRFPWLSRLLTDNVKVRNIAKKFNPDIVLSLQNTIISGLGHTKQAVYIHQSIPFQKEKVFSFLKRREFVLAIYQHIIGAFIKGAAVKASKVFVQTEWMKRSIVEKTRCDRDKVIVVPINKKSSQFDNPQKQWNNKSFFYPAFKAIYKNQNLILKSAQLLQSRGVDDLSIILTTKSGFACDLIKEVGQIPHEEVLSMLCQSTLLFPSYIETVGLPLIEAMQAGTVILAADCEYAHETLGKYENAYYFDPFHPVQLADLIEDVIEGRIVKTNLSIFQKSESNCWARIMDELLATN